MWKENKNERNRIHQSVNWRTGWRRQIRLKGTEEADSILSEFAKNLGITEEKLIENADSMHLTIDQYYDYASAVKSAQEAVAETSSTIDGLQDALDKASTALEEYNQNGYLTLDTFQDLMSIKMELVLSILVLINHKK